MGFEKFLFYVFAGIVVISGAMVVTRRNAVQAALFLVLAFVASSVLWLLLEAEFLAIALVLVYVGAVMVLFLFVVMMLDVDVAAIGSRYVRYLWFGVPIAAIMMLEILVVVLGPENFGLELFARPVPRPADYSNTGELGMVLYTVYMYPFEIAAVILLVAIVAAIRLTLRHRPDTKYEDPSKQIAVKKGSDRIKIMQVPAEPRVVPPPAKKPVEGEAEA